MKLLLRSALIIDPSSKLNGKKKDLLLENGKITFIGDGKDHGKDVTIIESENLHVSTGWVDMHCYLRDPGQEHKEDLASGSAAASFGGFTSLVCMPSTEPAIDNKSIVEYIRNKSASLITNIYPAGTITSDNKGTDLSEMYDMQQAGAVAFSEGKKSLKNSGMLSRALLYAKGIDATVLHFSEDTSLSSDGKMNEGINSTMLGLKGIPGLAEELCIARDLYIAEYNDSSIHIQTISTAKSVQLIREAKKKGIKVTCEVSANHLLIDDSQLSGFDSNYKVRPPFRTKEDIEALKEGLKDGTIDVICTDHTPHDTESKVKEFDLASFGIISLETAYAVLNTALSGVLTQQQIIEKISINPRKICKLPSSKIEEGAEAELTFFDPSMKWVFTEKDIKGKSRNTPYVGTEFKGKALGVCSKGKVFVA